MSARPWMLYLFSKGGIGAIGYKRAGFNVYGIDPLSKWSRGFPGDRFRAGNVLELLDKHGHKFQAIHASPPCTGYTIGTAAIRARGEKTYQLLIEPTREALSRFNVPWTIENVGQARAHLVDPVVLCGSMFNLTATDTDGEPLWMQRHRLFEHRNFNLEAPGACDHPKDIRCGGVYGAARTDKWEARYIRKGGYNPPREVQEDLMGVERGRFTRAALRVALPPAYTEWIGRHMMEQIR